MNTIFMNVHCVDMDCVNRDCVSIYSWLNEMVASFRCVLCILLVYMLPLERGLTVNFPHYNA